MPARNQNIANLKAGYLFPEIAKRRREYAAAHPEEKIISLGVGNTTEPVMPHINAGLVEGARRLGTLEGYRYFLAQEPGSLYRTPLTLYMLTALYLPEPQADGKEQVIKELHIYHALRKIIFFRISILFQKTA